MQTRALAMFRVRAHFGCFISQDKFNIIFYEKLICIRNIYFPALHMTSDEFKTFRVVVQSSAKYADIVIMMHALNTWWRTILLKVVLI